MSLEKDYIATAKVILDSIEFYKTCEIWKRAINIRIKISKFPNKDELLWILKKLENTEFAFHQPIKNMLQNLKI